MIAAQLTGEATAAERWAYALLVDLARFLPAEDGTASVAARVVTSGSEFSHANGELHLHRDVLDQVVQQAGAGQEQRSTARDRHGRVPAEANPLVQRGQERVLPVQELADRFARAADAAGEVPLPRLAPWPEGRSWAAAITHDLDVVSGWPLFAAMRWLELARKGEIARALRSVGSGIGAALANPVRDGVERFIRLEREAGIRATWFVLAGNPDVESWRTGDVTYRLEGTTARALLEALLQAEHEVGLHGSLKSAASADRMGEEREVIRKVAGKEPVGIRQHFLRMTPGSTADHAQRAGFTYDATYGFADRSGFRLGAADLLPMWNDARAEPLQLSQAPLAWMDRTFSKYQGEENPERWVDDALDLARTCREVSGLWVGLWHPNVVPALGYPDTWPAFERLLHSLVKEGAYIAPLEELTSWRLARRGLRGRRLAGGMIDLSSDREGARKVTVTDAGVARDYPWPAVRDG